MNAMKISRLLVAFCLLLVMQTSAAAVAPDWTLADADGNSVSLSDYKNKPVILHFWATWCPYCKKVQPGLDRLYRQHHQQGLEVLGISWWEDEGAEPQKELENRGHRFKTLINGDAVAKKYGVRGTPTTFFIDRNGEIVWVSNTSNPDDPALEKAVLRLLNSK